MVGKVEVNVGRLLGLLGSVFNFLWGCWGVFSLALVVVRTALFSLSVRGLLVLGSSVCCSGLCIDD